MSDQPTPPATDATRWREEAAKLLPHIKAARASVSKYSLAELGLNDAGVCLDDGIALVESLEAEVDRLGERVVGMMEAGSELQRTIERQDAQLACLRSRVLCDECPQCGWPSTGED